MSAHSTLGKWYGISEEDIDNLIYLDPDKFNYREWLVLKYAQDWTFLQGEEPVGNYMQDLKKHYSRKELSYTLKLMKAMLFSNYLFNLLRKKLWRSDIEGICVGDYCSINHSNTRKLS
ncbi:MAG: hypothetical protein SVZ03_03920 [Spirochaetota bacterium]|nr:hypothetical protein [Spirochaetota bacterium]